MENINFNQNSESQLISDKYQNSILQVHVFHNGSYIGWDCFKSERITVGSSIETDIVLKSSDISLMQAIFSVKNNDILISVASKTGSVRVNDKDVKKTILNPFDIVSIGNYALKLKLKKLIPHPSFEAGTHKALKNNQLPKNSPEKIKISVDKQNDALTTKIGIDNCKSSHGSQYNMDLHVQDNYVDSLINDVFDTFDEDEPDGYNGNDAKNYEFDPEEINYSEKTPDDQSAFNFSQLGTKAPPVFDDFELLKDGDYKTWNDADDEIELSLFEPYESAGSGAYTLQNENDSEIEQNISVFFEDSESKSNVYIGNNKETHKKNTHNEDSSLPGELGEIMAYLSEFQTTDDVKCNGQPIPPIADLGYCSTDIDASAVSIMNKLIETGRKYKEKFIQKRSGMFE